MADSVRVTVLVLVVDLVVIVPVGRVLSNLIPVNVLCVPSIVPVPGFHVVQYSKVLLPLEVVITGCPLPVRLHIVPPSIL